MKSLVFVLAIAVAVLAVLNLKQCNDSKGLKNDGIIKGNNIIALQDTVRIERNKEGEIQFSKQSLIADNKNLESLNQKLSEEVKKQKGQMLFLASSSASVKNQPAILVHDIQKLTDSTYVVTGDFNKVYDSLNFRTISVKTHLHLDTNKNLKVLKNELVKDEWGFNVVTGLKEENGNLRIFVRTDYPGLNFTKIDGALIDPTKSEVIKSFFPPKKFSLGIQLGYGINNELKTSPYIGVGIQYNIFSWNW